MIKNQNAYSIFPELLFAVYVVLLIWTLLFKLEFNIYPANRSVNLIPFSQPAVANDKINYSEIILNIAIFVPFGLFISILKFGVSFICKLLPVIIITVLIELFQYILQIGATDITDVINNILGGVIGILLYKLLYRFWGDKIDKAIIIVLSICILLFSVLIATIKIINA